MLSVRSNIDAAIEHLRECDGDIPDLLDQCSRLSTIADELDEVAKLPVARVTDECIRMADRVREQVESIKEEMGQNHV